MTARDSWQLLVFRDGKRVYDTPKLLHELLLQIEQVLSFSDFSSPSASDGLTDALLRAGELECALADAADSSSQTGIISEFTDELAIAAIQSRKPHFPADLLQGADALNLPQRVTLSPPEGFCYYALHPLDYANLLGKAHAEGTRAAAAVVGIRSIGTTLSAVVKAWFVSRFIRAERVTVRPDGYPFDRKLVLSETEQQWVRRNLRRGAAFWIVDEGPGLSGSSFLTTAEAMVEAGVPAERIMLLPSSEPDLSALFAPNAAARWRRFKSLPLSRTHYIPADAEQDISWGEWRKRVFTSECDWPAVWLWTERKKYLSSDGLRFFRFDGHGRYGKAVRERSAVLAEHGWGPQISAAGNGFSAMSWVVGNRTMQGERNATLQLARYCAFRAAQFQAEPIPGTALEDMTRINLERGLGICHTIRLPVECPVIADARMMPHEWISTTDNRLLKLDAAAHGDDHFYPGPCDIAWDLAGAIAEWKLSKDGAELLISEYTRISGDHIEKRLAPYLIAYCTFRLAFTRSAAQSVSDPAERARFNRDSAIYQERLEGMLPLSTVV